MSLKKSPASTTLTIMTSLVLSLFKRTERCKLPGLRPTLSFKARSVSLTASSKGPKLSRLMMFAGKTKPIYSIIRESEAQLRIGTKLSPKNSKTNRICQPQKPILRVKKLYPKTRFLKAATTLRPTQSTL